MFLQYTEKRNVQGDFLAEKNNEGFIERIEVEGRNKESSILQRGQCVGWFFSLLVVKVNKVVHSYFVFKTLDLCLGISHLKGYVFKGLMNFLVKWSPIFSQNKYEVGLTQEEYVIWLNNDIPVLSYTPWNSPAVEKDIGDELDKLEKTYFIEPSISPYSAPTVCVAKPDGTLRKTLTFEW